MTKKTTEASAALSSQPQIFEARLGPNGSVIKGEPLLKIEAEKRRRDGKDVVVCGPNLALNRQLACIIESAANGKCVRHPFHVNSGPEALPHYQPDPRPPEGHTFYETQNPNRKAR